MLLINTTSKFMYVIWHYLNRRIYSFTTTYTFNVTHCVQQNLCWKDKISHLVYKFPVFYGIRKFITFVTTVRHLPLFGAKFAHSTPSHPIFWSFMLILYNDVVHDLYTTQNTIRMIKSKVTWVVNIARKGEKKNAYWFLVQKPVEKRLLEKSSLKWEDNIKIYFKWI